jgi:glycine cleavage system H protein
MFTINRFGLNTTKILNISRIGIKNLSKSTILKNKIYTDTHEWYIKENNKIKIGLASSAIENMSELVYLEYPLSVDDIVSKDDDIVILESVKSVESIKAPFDCKILDQNTNFETDLDNINQDPEDINNWIIEIKEL